MTTVIKPTQAAMIKALGTRFILAVTAVMFTSTAHAQTSQSKPSDKNAKKIASVTQMYAQDIKNDGLGEPALHQFASKSLSKAFQREQAYFDREQMICGVGFDVLWESQDPDYSQDKSINMRDDLVAVSLEHGKTVHYKMICKKDCWIDDVIMSDGTSLKEYLNHSCQ